MSDTVAAALITVTGMVSVALVQWLVTRSVMRSEHDRLRTQLQSEFRLRQFEVWQSELTQTIAGLLAETDPEVHPSVDRAKVVPLIQRAQLLLNLDIPSHRKLNGLVNELGMLVNGWKPGSDMSTILGLHGAVLEAARDTLHLPGK